MGSLKTKSSSSQIAISSASDGIINLGGGQFRLVMEVSSLNPELMSEAESDYLLESYQSFLNSLDGQIQIVVRSRLLNLDNLFEAHPRTASNYRALRDYRSFLGALVDEHKIQTKNFYLIIPYQSDLNQLKPIADQLRLKADLINQSLSHLGLRSHPLSSAKALDLFYSFYCPGSHLNACLSAKLLKSYQSRPDRSLASLIGYDCLIEQSDHIKIDDCYLRGLYIDNYPHSAHSGFLKSLINFSGDIDISYQIEQIPAEFALPKLARKITELESTRRQRIKTAQIVGPEITDPLASATDLRDKIKRAQEKLFQLGVYICLRAPSLEQLNNQTKLLKNGLAQQLVSLKTARYHQLRCLEATLPRAQDRFYRRRNLNSAALALTFPFSSSQLVMPGGILHGVNQASNSLVILDRFQLNNANSVCFAQSGAGKSYSSKVEIIRQIMLGTQVIVIDPEREYSQLAQLSEAQIINLSPSSNQSINPLTTNPKTDKSESIQNLIEIIGLMVGGLKPKAKNALDKILVELLKHGPSPRLESVFYMLKEANQEQLAANLEPFVFGSLSRAFNNPSTLDLNKALIVFDIKDMPPNLHKLIMLVVANFVWSEVKTNPKRRLLVIDEAWLLLEQAGSANFLSQITRRARKYYLGVSLISQQANDFLNNPAGATLASQSSLRILMRQDSTTIKAVADNFNLSQQQAQLLLSAQAGQAIILADNQQLSLKVVASDKEHPLITTKPTEGFGS